MMNQLRRKLFLQAFRAAGKAGACRMEDSIVIAGAPRSGTTFLLELLQPLPGYEVANEPLAKKTVRERHGFYHRTFIAPGQPAKRQRAFLSQVLKGQGIPLYPCWWFDSPRKTNWLLEHALRRRLLVKFCRINRMLHWFDEQFDVRGTVFIVRHPCAVVNSMLNHPMWSNELARLKHDRLSSIYIGHLPPSVQEVFAPVIERISTQTEALATLWCLDHYLPFFVYDHHPWLLVAYESLVKQGRDELHRVAGGLDMTVTADMLARLGEPSRSTVDGVDADADAQLSKWKRQLSRGQIDDIIGILEEVGLSCLYSAAPEPDYRTLNRLQAPEHRWTDPAGPAVEKRASDEPAFGGRAAVP